MSDVKDNGHFVISFKLLQLLEWLVEHEPHMLKELIARSLAHGLRSQLTKQSTESMQTTMEIAQETIVDFFDFTEHFLHEALQESATELAVNKRLRKTVNHIDMQECSESAVIDCLDSTTQVLEHNPHKNAKETLYKELLRCWQPQNNNEIN